MRPRIQALDGLRFIAALGVLWIHSWDYFGNPKFYIGPVDAAGIMGIGRNGVDLFFVISGFCMYYFYAGHANFSYKDFGRFLFKRWVRLSPAFYVATIIYLFVSWVRSNQYQHIVPAIGTSALYLNSIFTQFNAAGHFWTLGAEWQFYLLIPFILIYQHRLGFSNIFLAIFGFLSLVAAISCFIFSDHVVDVLTNQIFFRGIEFGFGIIAARLLLKNYIAVKNRPGLLPIFVLVAFCGRFFISAQAMSLSQSYSSIIKLSGFALMGAGFAGVLYLAITSQGILNKLLSNRVFKTMGKISYSFYLWHALIIPFCATWIAGFKLPAMSSAVLATLLGTAVLYPISYLSYRLLEKPFLSVGNLTTK